MLITAIFPKRTFYIGDLWQWSVTLNQYPSASGWVLSYALKKPESATIILTSTPDTDGISHKFNVTSITNSGYLPGKYTAVAHITSNDGERITLGRCDLELFPDLTTVDDTYDPRSYDEKLLEAIEGVLNGSVSREYLETTFMDSTFKYKSTAELWNMRNRLKRKVDLEKGIKPGRIIRL